MPPKPKVTGANKKIAPKIPQKTKPQKTKKALGPSKPSPNQLDYKNLLELFNNVKHGLPMLPPTTISLIQNTYYTPLFENLTLDDETGEKGIDTGISLAYISPDLYNPHPFVFRRDFIVLQNGKIGGFPSWLIPHSIPSTVCPHCNNPMQFLLQFYSPIMYPNPEKFVLGEDDPEFSKQEKIAEKNIHRVVYCFVCTTDNCAVRNNSVKILRCQLPLVNDYISSQRPQYEPKMLEKHDFLYPLETLIPSDEALSASQTTQNTPLCIICGSKAVICGDSPIEGGSIPIYCSELHQQIDQNLYKLIQNDKNNKKNLFLESTILFPRLGFDIDFEVLDNDSLVHFKDQNDLQIEEVGTNRSALISAAEEAREICENKNDAENNQTASTSHPEDNTSTAESNTIPDEAKLEISQENTLIEQTLNSIIDPELKKKISPYLLEEQNKSEFEKYQDFQTFSPTLDEVDNHSITDQDQIAQNFNSRMEYTLPPYITEPYINQDELKVIKSDQNLKNHFLVQKLIKNQFSAQNFLNSRHFSKQILRFYSYNYRTKHKLAEPLWTHKINRLKVHHSDGIASSVVPELLSKAQSEGKVEHFCPDFLKCPNCGGKRLLEAQLTPYLCTYLLDIIENQQNAMKIAAKNNKNEEQNCENNENNENNCEKNDFEKILELKQTKELAEFDFSTIVIYTCENSCDLNNNSGYIEEFGYLQPAL